MTKLILFDVGKDTLVDLLTFLCWHFADSAHATLAATLSQPPFCKIMSLNLFLQQGVFIEKMTPLFQSQGGNNAKSDFVLCDVTLPSIQGTVLLKQIAFQNHRTFFPSSLSMTLIWARECYGLIKLQLRAFPAA